MIESRILRPLSRLTVTLLFFVLVTSTLHAQQPFVTDDADVTPKGRFHFEFSNEFDLLQTSAFPSLKQNTADFEFAYGLFDDVELSVAAPVLTIFNAAGTIPKTATGIGDMNVALKYNFRKERENSRIPALTVAVSLEMPTGDTSRQLGSGLADLYINTIVQRSLSKKTKLRLNGGILFSGNETTGAIGLKSRGTVFTAGGSIVKQLTRKLQLGVELTGAMTNKRQLGTGHMQTLFGGNYQFKNNLSLDFGVIAGKDDASPRAGAQLGISVDF